MGNPLAPSKISCRNLWKLFGPDERNFFDRHGSSPTDEALASSGYIGAVKSVSFEVAAGEILVIMGLSGSGKSTLIRCLTRLVEPTGGDIDFDGQSLLKASERELIEM